MIGFFFFCEIYSQHCSYCRQSSSVVINVNDFLSFTRNQIQRNNIILIQRLSLFLSDACGLVESFLSVKISFPFLS